MRTTRDDESSSTYPLLPLLEVAAAVDLDVPDAPTPVAATLEDDDVLGTSGGFGVLGADEAAAPVVLVMEPCRRRSLNISSK